VIRFDNRDTGRSVGYPPGQPEHSLRDMVDDAVGILNALSIGRAHFVGRSMAGAIVTLAAVYHPGRVAARTGNIACCLTNHFVIDFSEPIRFSEIHQPTLVVHGERDPVFPFGHALALQNEIPGAELLIMKKTGHELPPPVWDVFVPTLVQHTAR
jgi:pimeloyl-ACP methyl ester carboxylesterase